MFKLIDSSKVTSTHQIWGVLSFITSFAGIQHYQGHKFNQKPPNTQELVLNLKQITGGLETNVLSKWNSVDKCKPKKKYKMKIENPSCMN